jgi:hypothetical protein
MKKLILILLLTISNAAFGQDYYVMVSPNIAFDTKISDPKNLFGGTVEVGK